MAYGGNNMIDSKWLVEAIKLIQSGMIDRCEKNGIIVYRVKNIIRIDIKDNIEVVE